MPALIIVVVGFIGVSSAVAYVEFQAAPAGKKGQSAARAAVITAAIFCGLLVLAAGYEWLAGPANSP